MTFKIVGFLINPCIFNTMYHCMTYNNNNKNNKESKECQIDIAIPGDTRVIKKEEEKIERKYQELGFKLGRLWKVKTKVVPIVIGALGAIISILCNPFM